ncbi:hypothetical protein CRYUN_Cryun26dG0131800 [Craigia yunnanensis]
MEKEFKDSLLSSDVAVQRQAEEWSPPSSNCYKLNVDASYVAATGEAGLRMVIRNADAVVCLSAMTKVEGITSSFQAEILTILFGLQVATEKDFMDIRVENDCLVAINEISRRQESLSKWGSYLLVIMDRSLDFASCSFKHIKRSANGLAHNLAKFYCVVG